MKRLPLVEAGCSLSAEGLAAQRGRAATLRRSVRTLERSRGQVRIAFGSGVDEALLDELIETERGCCSFFALDYDQSGRTLTIAVSDPGREAALAELASFFEEAA